VRVKRFEANSAAQAMALVKAEFGDDAVILDTRKRRRSFLGLFPREYVEVTAALDIQKKMANSDKTPVTVKPLVPRTSVAPPTDASEKPAAHSIDVRQEAIIPSAIKKHVNADASPKAASKPDKTPVARMLATSHGGDDRMNRLENQISQISGLLENLLQQKAEHSTRDCGQFSGALGELCQSLVACDIDKSLALELCAELATSDETDIEALYANLKEIVLTRQITAGPLKTPELEDEEAITGPRIVTLVGPTGVGKTTTLAKISADFIVNDNQKVAYITQDTYRLAASEQLEKYADILNVPLEIVYEQEDFLEALERHDDCSLIFVDTAGRSQHNEDQLDELMKLMEVAPRAEAHLVLSAGTKNRELLDTVQQFSRIPISSLIFTKLDEALTCGSLFSTALRSGIPISYCTNGQNVPEDFFQADQEQLTDMLIENLRGVEAPGMAALECSVRESEEDE
jgi:flagellar biosynthesis protein FlhF